MKLSLLILFFSATFSYAQGPRFRDQHFIPAKTGTDTDNITKTDSSGTEQAVPKPYHFAASENLTLVRHEGFISAMHPVFNIPAWTYHRISLALLPEVSTPKRPGGYAGDPEYTSLKGSAYGGSGYDHGHLAPAADFKRSKELYIQSHYMTNMAPQHGCLNQIGWCYLESMTRNWAVESPNTVTHVISGCILSEFSDTLCHPSGLRICVPAYFFKAVLIEDTIHPALSKAIGFIVPNDDLTKEAAQASRCSIDAIEVVTGLDLFSGATKLDQLLLAQVESKTGSFGWEGYKVDCGTKKCENIYTGKRKKPEKRTKLLCR